jgi:acetolactate synthase-1/2/3 large subunit
VADPFAKMGRKVVEMLWLIAEGMGMNTADLIAADFEKRGFTHAFGIIGAGNISLYDAIARRGFTRLIPVHHEQAAAMAATYYWRTCGRLAPVLPTTGGGSANTLTGVIAAWMDSIPLLVVSGNEPSKYFREGCRVVGVQGYHSHLLPWVKFGERVMDAEDALSVLDHAIKLALRDRPGPVWVDICRDIQVKEVEREAI